MCPAYMRIRARVFSRLSEGGRKWPGCRAGVEIEEEKGNGYNFWSKLITKRGI